MTPWSSKRLNTVSNFYNTSTDRTPTYSSQLKNQVQMDPYPSWNRKVKPGPNNTIHTTVYRKPTHTDQYLHWDINHFITAKNSVNNTLAHRAKVVSSTTEDLNKEMKHLNKALKDCHFPNGALNRLQLQFQQKHNLNNTQHTRGRTNQQQQPGHKQ